MASYILGVYDYSILHTSNLKYRVINDFDEENFDKCCFLPVKHTITLFLLLLHVLVVVISYMYLCDDIFAVCDYHVYQDYTESLILEISCIVKKPDILQMASLLKTDCSVHALA